MGNTYFILGHLISLGISLYLWKKDVADYFQSSFQPKDYSIILSLSLREVIQIIIAYCLKIKCYHQKEQKHNRNYIPNSIKSHPYLEYQHQCWNCWTIYVKRERTTQAVVPSLCCTLVLLGSSKDTNARDTNSYNLI